MALHRSLPVLALILFTTCTRWNLVRASDPYLFALNFLQLFFLAICKALSIDYLHQLLCTMFSCPLSFLSI
jgi:hypothetical protein